MSEKTYNISKCSAQKSASDFDSLRPVCKFLESSNSKRKKSYAQISVFLNFGQTVVKLLIQEILVLLNNYSRILVLLNNYFSFLNFGQIQSNCGQTMVKLLIQEILVLLNNYSTILVLLNNYFSFLEFWSNLVKLWSNFGQNVVKLLIQEILVLLNNYSFLEQQF